MKRYSCILILISACVSAFCQDTATRKGTFNIHAIKKVIICSDYKERDTITVSDLLKDPVLVVDSCKNCRVTSFNFVDITDKAMRSRTVLGEHLPKDFIKAYIHKVTPKPINIQNVFFKSGDKELHAMHGIPIYVK